MNKKRISLGRITHLAPNEVFVFGSNLQGAYGGGAARMAYEHFGAVWGKGVGMYGQTYAIPTMQGGVETIKPYVDDFRRFATVHGELDFLVMEIGCGIAGFTPKDIAPMFFKVIENDIKNVYLPESFYEVWEYGTTVNWYYKVCECGLLYPYKEDKCPYCGYDSLWAIDHYRDHVFKAVKIKVNITTKTNERI